MIHKIESHQTCSGKRLLFFASPRHSVRYAENSNLFSHIWALSLSIVLLSACGPAWSGTTEQGWPLDRSRQNARFEAEIIAGHGTSTLLNSLDSIGIASLLPPSANNLLVSGDGKWIYLFSRAQVLRFDPSTQRMETLSGLGWPGYRDGPASVTQFHINFYQSGGHGLSPDGRHIYLTANGVIRRIDTNTGETTTIHSTNFPDKKSVRTLAVGRSGRLYLLFHSRYFVFDPATGSSHEYQLVLSEGGWGKGRGQPPGYIAVDESRGVIYGVERNRKNGAFYRWPIRGGTVEWLNNKTTGTRHRQYTSDGPVSDMEMANPMGCTVDDNGFVYIGAGDGRTFRRFDPEKGTVTSLCQAPGSSESRILLEWCIGDGQRNKVFGTWPSFLGFDKRGDFYMGYSVWPKLVRLRKLKP